MAEFRTTLSSPNLPDEEEICQKLIHLSFSKIMNSKHERGGAKLHKNLLILHLLQNARSEQRRSLDSLIPPSSMEIDVRTELDDGREEEEDSDSGKDVFFDESDDESDEPDIVIGRSEAEANESPAPLLRFVSLDDDEEEVSVEITSTDFTLTDQDFVELSQEIQGFGDDALSQQDHPRVLVEEYGNEEKEDMISNVVEEDFLKDSSYFRGLWDEGGVGRAEEPPKSFTITEVSAKKSKKSSSTDSGCSSGSSSPSSSEEEEEESGDSDDSLTSPPLRKNPSNNVDASSRRRRKRKHRSPSFADNLTANKKTCVDSIQLSGLISVFENTGLEGIRSGETDSHFEERTFDFSLPIIKCSASKENKGSCGAESVPPRSISCPSFLELTCNS